MNAGETLRDFDGQKYLNLETYRKIGTAVRTPVWFAAAADGSPRLYIYSTADSGKAKRIRNGSVCKIAPCDARGRVVGTWIDAKATIATGRDAAYGMGLINYKYRPLKLLFDLFLFLSKKHDRVVIVIIPVCVVDREELALP
jgi:hypothetical protein